jgi:hypothetical protein
MVVSTIHAILGLSQEWNRPLHFAIACSVAAQDIVARSDLAKPNNYSSDLNDEK